MRFFTTVDSDCGRIFIESNETVLTRVCFFNHSSFEELRGSACLANDRVILQLAREQITDYFLGARQFFSLPLLSTGTPFQKKVWNALLKIPYGETRTYGEIAMSIGSPLASRAVGSANHVNPFTIIVPCHRVVGANGRLVGYAGGVETKRKLLDLEHRFSRCRHA